MGALVRQSASGIRDNRTAERGITIALTETRSEVFIGGMTSERATKLFWASATRFASSDRLSLEHERKCIQHARGICIRS